MKATIQKRVEGQWATVLTTHNLVYAAARHQERVKRGEVVRLLIYRGVRAGGT